MLVPQLDTYVLDTYRDVADQIYATDISMWESKGQIHYCIEWKMWLMTNSTLAACWSLKSADALWKHAGTECSELWFSLQFTRVQTVLLSEKPPWKQLKHHLNGMTVLEFNDNKGLRWLARTASPEMGTLADSKSLFLEEPQAAWGFITTLIS